MAARLQNSVEYKLGGNDGIIISVRVMDATDRHLYSVDVDGLTPGYVTGCIHKLSESLKMNPLCDSCAAPGHSADECPNS